MRYGICGVLMMMLLCSSASAQDVGSVASQTDCIVGGKPIDSATLHDAAVVANLTASGRLKVGAAIATMVAGMEHVKNPSANETTLIAFEDAVRTDLQDQEPEFQAKVACLYANHFSPDELQTLRKFYETGLGQKLEAENKLIAQETLKLALTLAPTTGARAAERAREKLRLKGVKI